MLHDRIQLKLMLDLNIAEMYFSYLITAIETMKEKRRT
jgi:hypothetical protein